jgi:acetyltransferase EpsM
LDDDRGKKGKTILQTMVRGPLAELPAKELNLYSIVVAIAVNKAREHMVEVLTARGARLEGVRHPSAIISPSATVHPTAQIMAGVIVNARATVGAHAVLNTGCIVDHDASVGEFAHIGPGAMLAGAVVAEAGVFVATGAKVCPSVRLGRASTLGAGAVALRDLPAGCVAVGVPARQIRSTTV